MLIKTYTRTQENNPAALDWTIESSLRAEHKRPLDAGGPSSLHSYAHARSPAGPPDSPAGQSHRLCLSAGAAPAEPRQAHAPEFAPLSARASFYALRVNRNSNKSKIKVSPVLKKKPTPQCFSSSSHPTLCPDAENPPEDAPMPPVSSLPPPVPIASPR